MVEPVKGPFRLPVAGELMTGECSMQAFAACPSAYFGAPPSRTFVSGHWLRFWPRAGQIFDLHVLQHSQSCAAAANDLQAAGERDPLHGAIRRAARRRRLGSAMP